MLRPPSLTERLQQLRHAEAAGLLRADEAAQARAALACSFAATGVADEPSVPPPEAAPEAARTPPPPRAHDAIATTRGVTEDTDDVVSLPFKPKEGAATRAESDFQEFYNREMLEVCEAYPGLLQRDRQREVMRRWELRVQVGRLREDTRRLLCAAKAALRAATGDAAARLRPRSPAGRRSTGGTVTPPLELRAGDALQLEGTASALLRRLQAEHDAVLVQPIAAVGAELVSGEPPRLFERKPHLFRALRTAEVATVDSHRLHALARQMGVLRYLQQKLRRCLQLARALEGGGDAAGLSLSPASPVAAAQQQQQQQPSSPAPAGRAPPSPCVASPPVMAAWRKFVRAAEGKLAEHELRLVSRDTLCSLLDHFGGLFSATETHWVHLQWQAYQEEMAQPQPLPRHTSPPRSPPSAGRVQSVLSPSSPHILAAGGLAGEAHRRRLQSELSALRQEIEERELLHIVEARVRADYDEALRAAVADMGALADRRREAEEAQKEELARAVRQQCAEMHAAERAALQARCAELSGEVARLRSQDEAAEQRLRAAVEGARTATEQKVRAELTAEFRAEVDEVRSMRGAYEIQLAQLREQTARCDAQNSRLSTELQSSYSERLVADLRAGVRGELEVKWADRERDFRTEVAQLRTALVDAQRRLREKHDSEVQREQLYGECLAEMRDMAEMAGQRDALQHRIDEVHRRITALRRAPSSRCGSPPVPGSAAPSGEPSGLSPARLPPPPPSPPV